MMMRTTPQRASAADHRAVETAVARIESLDYDGHGVAHVEGKAVFIDDALPGELVRFRYRRRRRRHDTGVTEEVLEPSEERITAPCRYFGRCGGCSLQHFAPAAQLRAKQQVLADNLAHLGQVQPERWLAPISGPSFGYRRRARLGVRFVPKKGGVLVGFRERRHSFITNLDECLTLDPSISRLLVPLRETIAKLSCPARIPQAEVAAADNATVLVLRHLEALTAHDRATLSQLAHEQGISVYLQSGGPDTLRALEDSEPEPLFYDLSAYSLRMHFEPLDFIQVNRTVNEQTIARAIELLEPEANDAMLDLFCGVGNFTLPVARSVGAVVGIEGDATLVARARRNAAINGLDNARFVQDDLFAGQQQWTHETFTKVLLDPPRAGAIDAVKALAQVRPACLVYVSCNPATLARDAQYLVHVLGYRLESAGVIDMFPQTSHVEAIARFLRD